MAEAVKSHGVVSEFATTDDDGPGCRLEANAPERRIPLRNYFAKCSEFYTVAAGFSVWLGGDVSRYDLIHVHGLFSYVNAVAGRACRRAGVPYIVTPHGMANAYGMAHKPCRKKLSFALVERPLLNGAAAVHMTSAGEQVDFDLLAIKAPVRLLPLSVDLPAAKVTAQLFSDNFPDATSRQIVAFVGRLNPIKNLERLIDAMVSVTSELPDALLVICGSGEQDYVRALAQRVTARGLDDHVVWAGHVEEQMKWSVLAAASCFVLPSVSESFGLSAVEAAAVGTPCIVSDKVAVAGDLARLGAAVAVDHDARSLAQGITSVLTGKNAPVAPGKVRERFSRGQMGEGLVEIYSDALKSSGSRPVCKQLAKPLV